MKQIESDIERIVSELRDDLREETIIALKLCYDSELESILEKIVTPGIMCLEIESVFSKMILLNRLEESSIPTWEIKEGLLYEFSKTRYLPEIRNAKINKLIGNNVNVEE